MSREPFFTSARERLSLAEAAGELGVHVATVWRWTLRGVKGRKLRSMLFGGRRVVLRADLEAFLAPENGETNGNAGPTSAAEKAGKGLDEMFRGRQRHSKK